MNYAQWPSIIQFDSTVQKNRVNRRSRDARNEKRKKKSKLIICAKLSAYILLLVSHDIFVNIKFTFWVSEQVSECGKFSSAIFFNQDVHDRGLLYYRLLRHGVETAERVINPTKQAVSVFAETQSSEIKDRIFDEFNSLAVVYQQVKFSDSYFVFQVKRNPFLIS